MSDLRRMAGGKLVAVIPADLLPHFTKGAHLRHPGVTLGAQAVRDIIGGLHGLGQVRFLVPNSRPQEVLTALRRKTPTGGFGFTVPEPDDPSCLHFTETPDGLAAVVPEFSKVFVAGSTLQLFEVHGARSEHAGAGEESPEFAGAATAG